jgi:hypothetical protein
MGLSKHDLGCVCLLSPRFLVSGLVSFIDSGLTDYQRCRSDLTIAA